MSKHIDEYKNAKKLGIGEIIISENKEEIIWTVLGSCISIIFHVDNLFSIICHAQLPYNSITAKCSDECSHPCRRSFDQSLENRFVKCSLDFMLKKLKTYSFDSKNLKTTLIGGASIIPKKRGLRTIGELNVITAKEMLKNNRIRINREKVGGLNGYNLWYHTDKNRLFIKVINEDIEKYELLDNI
jgi:chemotaxis receptor (MCP) glutamine deamidase CheD